ncbi:MAG TPA: hypothetical protein VK158_05005 [Acidobacteriota bacterium]|nr:hypothetical protein [Acidobacteriota bacterium]
MVTPLSVLKRNKRNLNADILRELHASKAYCTRLTNEYGTWDVMLEEVRVSSFLRFSITVIGYIKDKLHFIRKKQLLKLTFETGSICRITMYNGNIRVIDLGNSLVYAHIRDEVCAQIREALIESFHSPYSVSVLLGYNKE